MGRPFVHIAAIGNKYNRWTVTDDSTNWWRVRCECGAETSVRRDHVLSGRSKSCMACAQRKHGMESTKIYNVWAGMKQRCQNPNYHGFDAYGGRGIKVCEAWQDFQNFYRDMGDPPSANSSIDRIDNNGNYEPSNCRWATPKQQQGNRKITQMLEYNGESHPLTMFAEAFGIERHTLQLRIKRGWSVEDALHKPVRQTATRKPSK